VNYKLSYRDLVEMMAERGLAMAHSTILRWVQRFVPVAESKAVMTTVHGAYDKVPENYSLRTISKSAI
jgi:transposase-like protein